MIMMRLVTLFLLFSTLTVIVYGMPLRENAGKPMKIESHAPVLSVIEQLQEKIMGTQLTQRQQQLLSVGSDEHAYESLGRASKTTKPPTTKAPTTKAPTTKAPTTKAPTTSAPTTQAPTTIAPTTQVPTTAAPTTLPPTEAPTTVAPTTVAPTTAAPTTQTPTTAAPTTEAPTTAAPTTEAPTTPAPTEAPTEAPTTEAPTTAAPTTEAPTTEAPTTAAPATAAPTVAATPGPTTPPPVLAPDTAPPGSYGLAYAGGVLMTNRVTVYPIYYGTWNTPEAAARIDLINTFITNMGASAWWNIQTSYYQVDATTGTRTYIQPNNIGLGKHLVLPLDPARGGTSLTDAYIYSIIKYQVSTLKTLPADTNGVVVLIPSSEVTTAGLCSQFCGFHTAASMGGAMMKYAYIGDGSVQCPTSCTAFVSSIDGTLLPSPNNDISVDAVINILAHEVAEAVTDPQLTAWVNADGNENADICSWQFGQTYITSNGAKANMRIGNRDFLIQSNLKNRDGGGCVLSLY